jgi:hypothetical protein
MNSLDFFGIGCGFLILAVVLVNPWFGIAAALAFMYGIAGGE